MSFIESRPLDNYIALGSSSGPEYQTDIIELSSGIEQRNQSWEYPRHRYLVGISAGKSTKIETLRQLFHSTRGAFSGFRFKDYNDYSSATIQGDTVAYDDQDISVGDGATLTYQVLKNYTTLTTTVQRKITKLVSGSFLTGFTGESPTAWSIQDTGTTWAIDEDTGIITYAADIQKTITGAVDVGGVTTRLTSVGHTITSATDTIALSTFTGNWDGLNSQRFNITGLTIDTIDIAFNSSAYAAYSGNGGQLNTIPQTFETIVWGAEFDVPVRFSSDGIQISQISPGIEQASVELIEIK